jgi:hypothetical protein
MRTLQVISPRRTPSRNRFVNTIPRLAYHLPSLREFPVTAVLENFSLFHHRFK